MFFKKKILTATIYFNNDELFLIMYSKDTNGLSFMSSVDELDISKLSNNLIGEECLKGLNGFKTGVKPPYNVSTEIKPLLKKMGCNSWNSLFSKFNSIDLEGVTNKYVEIQPSIKKTRGKSKFYATNQEKIIKVEWDASIVGEELLKLMKQY